MSENNAHKEFKDKLRNFLRDDVAGPPALRRTDIAFPCDDHTHLWPMPPTAAWVESERRRQTTGGVKYLPDIIILDYRDNPLAILEVTDSNRKNNSRRAADELKIPWFRFWAPPSEATQAELSTRVYPDDWTGFRAEHDGWSSDIEGWFDEQTGGERYGTIYHSEVAPGSINIGHILYANSTNLSCEWADWYSLREQSWKSATWRRDGRHHTAQAIGGEILHAMQTMQQNPQQFTAGIGSYQLHGSVGIYPLNPEPGTRRYSPVDIATLLERWQESDSAMRQSLDAFKSHCKTTPPPFLPAP